MSTVITDDLRTSIFEKIKAGSIMKSAAIAETVGVPEVEVLRSLPAGWATELRAADAEAIIRSLETWGTVYFICRNAACVTEISGQFGGFSRSGPFLNVNSKHLHLHLRTERIGAIVAVHQRAEDGDPSYSLQFFQMDGASTFKVYLISSVREESDAPFEEALGALRNLATVFRK